MFRFVKYYLPPLVWAGFIFWNSAQPHLHVSPMLFIHADKVAHFVVYFILGVLLMRAFRAWQPEDHRA